MCISMKEIWRNYVEHACLLINRAGYCATVTCLQNVNINATVILYVVVNFCLFVCPCFVLPLGYCYISN